MERAGAAGGTGDTSWEPGVDDHTMELTPRDLGTERYLTILRRRLLPSIMTVNGTAVSATGETIPPLRKRRREGRVQKRIQRYWTRDLNLDADTSEAVADIISRGTPGVNMKLGIILSTIYMFFGAFLAWMIVRDPMLPMMFLTAWALIVFASVVTPRNSIKTAHNRAVTVQEVEAMLPGARGRLERMYLNLVLDALRLELPSESAKADIQSALRNLGDAISRLPADPVGIQDATSLRKEAMELRQQAASEHDGFIQASLHRQAEALERRASMVAQNSRAARRSAALRREARIQMDNLRGVMVSYSQLSASDLTAVGQISEAVQRVSAEAQALSLAQGELEHDELTALFGEPLPAVQAPPLVVPQPTIAPQQVVVQQNTTQPSAPVQQPQTVTSRQWWRNG